MSHILPRGVNGEGVQGASFCFVLSQPPAPSSVGMPGWLPQWSTWLLILELFGVEITSKENSYLFIYLFI